MPPGEFSKRPIQGRPPYPRHRTSMDGVLARGAIKPSAARPTPSPHDARRQYVDIMPTKAAPTPLSTPPVPAEVPQPTQAQLPVPNEPAVTDEDQLFQSLQSDQDVPYTPKAATPVPKSIEPSQLSATPEPEVAVPTAKPESAAPTPRPKKRRLRIFLKVLFIICIALACGAAAYTALRYETTRNDPTNIFTDALGSALSTSQLQIKTTVGSNSSEVSLDFSVPTNILASNKAKVNLAGASVAINGYGSAKSTYVSYQQLPSGTPAKVSSVAGNAWVQLRSKGVLPPGVSSTLSNVADPRYLSVGPIIFGNFLDKNSKQLINYAATHNIYRYDPKQVTHTVKDNVNVLAYPVKLALSDLKILNDSAGSSEGFNPGDIQAAVNKFDAYKDADVTIYIASSTHLFMGIDIVLSGGQTISTRYSSFDHVSLPAEPQTKLTWSSFAGVQRQIEAQAAANQTPTQIDALRANKLAAIHTYLGKYFADNNAYPTYTQLNDPVWLQNNLAGLDPDALYDPLATILTLSMKPAANSFAYQPLAADGTSGCDNLTQNCDHYNLTATLSTTKPSVVHDP
jgi:hypothetical protein